MGLCGLDSVHSPVCSLSDWIIYHLFYQAEAMSMRHKAKRLNPISPPPADLNFLSSLTTKPA